MFFDVLAKNFYELIFQLLLNQGNSFGEQWLITLARNILQSEKRERKS